MPALTEYASRESPKILVREPVGNRCFTYVQECKLRVQPPKLFTSSATSPYQPPNPPNPPGWSWPCPGPQGSEAPVGTAAAEAVEDGSTGATAADEVGTAAETTAATDEAEGSEATTAVLALALALDVELELELELESLSMAGAVIFSMNH